MDRGLSTFKTVYLELIGNDATAKEIADFLSSRVGVDSASVRAYLTTTPVFINKYSIIIRSLYMMHHGVDPTDETIQEYMVALRNSAFDLEDGIKRNSAEPPSTPAPPTASDMQTYAKTAATTTTVPHPLPSSPMVIIKAPELDLDTVDAFEAIAKRPMSVHEYFQYVVEDSAPRDWIATWKKQVDTYNRIRNLMHDYCEMQLTEHDFLRNHLVSMDEPKFEVDFVDDIVAGAVYATQMKSRLCKIYKETFDSEMSQVDVDYLFESVKRDKRSLASGELRGVVMDFYKETNNIIAHASEIYNKVLDRYPDSVELVDVVSLYRMNAQRGMDDIAVDLERQLVCSLEFHDVLRTRIQKAAAASGKSLIPSKLYGILQKLLSKIDTITMYTLPGEINKLLD